MQRHRHVSKKASNINDDEREEKTTLHQIFLDYEVDKPSKNFDQNSEYNIIY